jgi:hypothetical protein
MVGSFEERKTTAVIVSISLYKGTAESYAIILHYGMSHE